MFARVVAVLVVDGRTTTGRHGALLVAVVWSLAAALSASLVRRYDAGFPLGGYALSRWRGDMAEMRLISALTQASSWP